MIKRLFDFVVSSISLFILWPVLLVLAIKIKQDSKGTVFYHGLRVGLHGKPFRIFKFRTMVMDAEKIGPSSTAGDDSRLTGIGRVLRRYKLDELPQLINVFKGEMSFVGPRPEVKKFTDMYTEEEKIILTLRPGITDWASLKFPNEDEILDAHSAEYPNADEAYAVYIRPEKINLQLQYANHHNIWIDLQIIFKTIWTVLSKMRRDG